MPVPLSATSPTPAGARVSSCTAELSINSVSIVRATAHAAPLRAARPTRAFAPSPASANGHFGVARSRTAGRQPPLATDPAQAGKPGAEEREAGGLRRGGVQECVVDRIAVAKIRNVGRDRVSGGVTDPYILIMRCAVGAAEIVLSENGSSNADNIVPRRIVDIDRCTVHRRDFVAAGTEQQLCGIERGIGQRIAAIVRTVIDVPGADIGRRRLGWLGCQQRACDGNRDRNGFEIQHHASTFMNKENCVG